MRVLSAIPLDHCCSQRSLASTTKSQLATWYRFAIKTHNAVLDDTFTCSFLVRIYHDIFCQEKKRWMEILHRAEINYYSINWCRKCGINKAVCQPHIHPDSVQSPQKPPLVAVYQMSPQTAFLAGPWM